MSKETHKITDTRTGDILATGTVEHCSNFREQSFPKGEHPYLRLDPIDATVKSVGTKVEVTLPEISEASSVKVKENLEKMFSLTEQAMKAHEEMQEIMATMNVDEQAHFHSEALKDERSKAFIEIANNM